MEILFAVKLPILSPNRSTFFRTQIKEPIECARNRKTRPGSVKSAALFLKSAYMVASKLRIIPEPLDSAIREFSGGSGGGSSGGFGFNWGGFDGGSRRRKRKLGFLWVLIVGCFLCLWLILGKEVDSELMKGIMGLCLFGVSISGWKLGFIDWVLGFCCCAFLVSLGVNREQVKIWVKGFCDVVLFKGRKRRGIW